MKLQIVSDLSELQLSLTPTGIKIASITSSPELCFTDSHGMFYVKTGHDFELKQLLYMKSKRLPLPGIIAFDPKNANVIATKDSGISLEAYFERQISMKNREFLSGQAGKLLKKIHKTLSQDIPPEVLRTSYKPTAHIVDCFFYKYPQKEKRVPLDLYIAMKNKTRAIKRRKKVFKQSNRKEHFLRITGEGDWDKFHNASLELQHLIYLLDRVGALYMRKMTPHIYQVTKKNVDGSTQTYDVLEEFSEKPMYGDFKPENLIVEHIKNPTELMCIDPEIMLGTPMFDLAKFINRYLIDVTVPSHKKLVINFLSAYTSKKINVSEKIYGPFTFLDLMTLDLLNLFKSLLSRYSANEKQYRLAVHLDDPEFCNKITQLILDIQTIRSHDEFYNYLRQG